MTKPSWIQTARRHRNLPYRLKSDIATIHKASTTHRCHSPGCQRQIERDEYYVAYYGIMTESPTYFHLDPCAINMHRAERIATESEDAAAQ
jgi:hypothetical protein